MTPSAQIAGCFALLLATVTTPAAGTVRYVDPNGSDDGPGSVTQPIRTIGRAASQAQPGDLVVVNSGTYQESVILPRSGSAAAPIVFRGLPGAVLTSPDPSASLSAFDVGANADVTIEGFEMTGGFDETVYVRPGAHDVALSGLHIHGNHTGIWIAGASYVTVSDSVLDHNFRTGIRIFAGANHVRVADTLSQANDDGLGCNGDSDGFNTDASTSDVTFERATAAGNSEDGFDLKGPNMALLQVTAQDNGCSGVKIAAGGDIENLVSEGNKIGVDINAPAGATTVLLNGTIADNDPGVRVIGSAHTVVVRNSIISGSGKALDYPASVQLQEDHNILFRPLSKDRLIVCEEAGGQVLYSGDDVASGKWRRESGQGDGTAYANPTMHAFDCQLQCGSPAIDTGSNPGAPPVDRSGTPRPMGTSVDRGAFEWMPIVPALRVRRAVLRADSTSSGDVQLRAEVDAPSGLAFDPASDIVSVSLRGMRGDVFRIDVPPTAWKAARLSDGVLLRLAQRTPAGSAVLTLRWSAGDASLRLHARGADLWVLDGNDLTITVELGHIRASTDATLRTLGHAFCLR
ncbi:MAG: right-handed parallel beta-helix repeat-containing protein [Candidatus Binatia bacterium]